MVKTLNLFIGVTILALTFGLYMTVSVPADLTNTETFDTSYPIDGDWNNSGQFFGDATTDNGGAILTLQGTSTTGTYLSDVRMSGQDNDVLFLTFSSDVENIAGTAYANLTIRGLDDGVVVAQNEYALQNGENLIDNRAFRNFTFDSYEFEIDMGSGSNTDRIPRISDVTIAGETRPDSSFLKNSLFVIGIGLGLMFMIRSL